MAILVDPTIFKAYDVRGIYPQEVNEDVARAIGRAFVAYLKATRIPIITKQVCGAFGAIEFEGRTPVALNAMTGDQRGQRTILMP